MSNDQQTLVPPWLDQGVLFPEFFGSNDVEILLAGEMCRFSLRIRPENLSHADEALGIALPRKIGTVASLDSRKIFCLGPDEWFILAEMGDRDQLQSEFNPLSQKCALSAVDISHRNIGMTISGVAAAELINVGCALDLHAKVFPVNKCTRTAFESAETFLYRKSETSFYLETWRSFAPYVSGFFKRHLARTS